MRHWPLLVASLLLVGACSETPPVPPVPPSAAPTQSPSQAPTLSPTRPPTQAPTPSATATATPTPTPSQLAQVPEAQHGASPFPSPSPGGASAYNLANAVVQAGAGNETARGAIDGNLYTEWNARQGVGPSTWLTIDLGTSETVSRVDLLPDASPDALCYFNVQTSIDGKQWTTAAQDGHGLGSNSAPTWASVKFTATSARYVRLQPTDWGARSWVAVWEIKLYP